jgi:hypothetical protein
MRSRYYSINNRTCPVSLARLRVYQGHDLRNSSLAIRAIAEIALLTSIGMMQIRSESGNCTEKDLFVKIDDQDDGLSSGLWCKGVRGMGRATSVIHFVAFV